MLMLMNAWMMLVLMKCQMQCLTLGCYINIAVINLGHENYVRFGPRVCQGLMCFIIYYEFLEIHVALFASPLLYPHFVLRKWHMQ